MKIKKLISVLMISLMIVHGIYQLIIFKTFQTVYQSEMSSKIEDGSEDEIILFTFRINDLPNLNIEWIEDDEFRFEKKMFDVISKKVNRDSIYIYCIHDDKESDLYLVMDKIFKGLIEDDSDKLKMLFSYLSQFYSKPDETEFDFQINNYGNSFTQLNSDLLEGEHFLLSPPPRI